MAFQDLSTDYAGRKGPMFWLALKTGLATVLTLGFYRFWMKTRMRRYYWSAIRPGGSPLEYVGRPSEKLLGFLVAVVFMAFYIGVVNLVLMFFSFTLFQGNFVAYGLSFAGLAPMIFFAQYRARRYVLARTRWRGIRFGLEPGAWGYAWRAAVHWTVTALSLGLLWPRMAFWLEKYRIDRTYFGDARFEQSGRWTMLLGAMKHVYLSGAFLLVISVLGAATENPAVLLLAVLGVPWLGFGMAYWKAESFRRLTNTKRLGQVGLRSAPRVGRIVGIYLGGSLAIAAILAALSLGLLLLLGLVLTAFGAAGALDRIEEAGDFSALPAWAAILAGGAAYFAVFVFWGVLKEVFLTLPLARHFAEVTEVVNPVALGTVHQRDRDEFVEAEGFAEALDVGAAI